MIGIHSACWRAGNEAYSAHSCSRRELGMRLAVYAGLRELGMRLAVYACRIEGAGNEASLQEGPGNEAI